MQVNGLLRQRKRLTLNASNLLLNFVCPTLSLIGPLENLDHSSVDCHLQLKHEESDRGDDVEGCVEREEDQLEDEGL
jgi:hypothetical protein